MELYDSISCTTLVLAGILSEVITYPLSTILTNYHSTQYISIDKTVHNILSKKGGINTIKSFYIGLLPALLSGAVESIIKYIFYSKFKTTTSLLNIVIISGTLVSLFRHPLDIIRIQQTGNYFGIALMKRELSFTYFGYLKTLVNSILGYLSYIYAYRYLISLMDNPFSAYMISTVVSSIICHPLEYAKTRHSNGLMMHLEWPYSYLKGLTITIAKTMVSGLITSLMCDIHN